MQKKVEFCLCRSIIGWCVPIKVAYLDFFPELQIFAAPELQVELFYCHLQKDANVNSPTNTFVRIDV